MADLSAPPTRSLRDTNGSNGLGPMSVNVDGDDDDDVSLDPKNAVVSIELPDGSVNIHFGGAPQSDEPKDSKFDDNLAEFLPDDVLNMVAEDLLRGYEADELSRQDWVTQRAEGIKWLGLRIEKPGGAPSDGTAPVEGMSKVYHPMLTEVCLRGRAQAAGELLPADGPVKVTNDATEAPTSDAEQNASGDQLADCLERDFNHFFTTTASEYYPDTRRMLFWVYFGGTGFKKVYRDPLRRRPVSESVDANDLIVSNAATDLLNADRITHRSEMRPSIMKRMMKIGTYRDVDLQLPVRETPNDVTRAKEDVSGIHTGNMEPEDEPHTVLEMQCLYDLEGYEHKEDGKQTGIPLPYVVTIEKTSRTVLAIRRDWKEDDDNQQRKKRYVKFSFSPMLGFYDIGLLQLIGNATVAATAIWRMAIDGGMFASFPGSVHAKIANRQNNINMRIGPGESLPVDVPAGMRIQDAFMPLPYKDASPGLFQIGADINTTGMRVGGAADIQVGEGKQNAPVGTTIALIEQATMVISDVHKGLHASQAEEFQLVRDLFRENPEDFWRFNTKPATPWDRALFLKALNDSDISPKADPNTASYTQRIMRGQALYMMAQADPGSFDKVKTYQYLFSILRIPDGDHLLVQSQGPPADPKAEAAKIGAQADLQDSQTKAGELAFRVKNSSTEDENRDKDRQSKEKIAQIELQRDAIVHANEMQNSQALAKIKASTDIGMQNKGHQRDAAQLAAGHQQEQGIQAADHAHQMRKAAVDAMLAPKPAPKPAPSASPVGGVIPS